ncbi:MAG: HAD family hydrolase [Anaerolineae bacterium]
MVDKSERCRGPDAPQHCGGLLAVTFDFWGTLYQNAYARVERLRLFDDALQEHRHPRSPQELDAAYEHARSVWEHEWREEQRSISTERWVDEVLGYLDAKLPDGATQRLGRAIENCFLRGDDPRPVRGVGDVLPRLAQRYRLGLISDTGLTPGRVLRHVLRRDGLLRCFGALTFSDELGTAKPRPTPFLHTLEILDVRPEQAAHVGDLPETDMRGARGVGMKTLLFLGVTGREDGRGFADGVFHGYHELEPLLEVLDRG